MLDHNTVSETFRGEDGALYERRLPRQTTAPHHARRLPPLPLPRSQHHYVNPIEPYSHAQESRLEPRQQAQARQEGYQYVRSCTATDRPCTYRKSWALSCNTSSTCRRYRSDEFQWSNGIEKKESRTLHERQISSLPGRWEW